MNSKDPKGLHYPTAHKYVCPNHGDVSSYVISIPGRFRSGSSHIEKPYL